MKKIILVLILIALFAPPALATSGACSHHKGVNCSAGADYDGSVICNDGNRNSSVSYSSMVMCSGYNTTYEAPVIKTVAPVVAPVVPVQTPKIIELEPKPAPKFEFPDCPANAYYSSLSDQCECSLGYEKKSGKCVIEIVKEMDIEESYDYLNIPTTSEKPKTVSKVEVPLKESAKTSTNEDAAAGAVVGLGALAGAGYLFKRFRRK